MGKTRGSDVDIRTQKTLDQMADAEVLATALDEMEFLGLINWKPDDDKKPAVGESREAYAQRQASSGLALAEHDLRASLRSIEDQVRQHLADNGFLVAPT